jgi:hypothetical protein
MQIPYFFMLLASNVDLGLKLAYVIAIVKDFLLLSNLLINSLFYYFLLEDKDEICFF